MHGAHVPHDVDLEHKQEADHVSPVTHVELDAQDHQLNHEPVEPPLVSEKNTRNLLEGNLRFAYLTSKRIIFS